jgi:hypothetical protein
MTHETPIVEVTADKLGPSELCRLFHQGAIAVVLVGDPRVRRVWEALVLHATRPGIAEDLPWNASLVEIARNHRAGTDVGGRLGDVVEFFPGAIGYIGRKLELSRHPTTGELSCQPATFSRRGITSDPDLSVFSLCWEIIADLMKSAGDGTAPVYRVAVQRLKYEHDLTDIVRLCELMESNFAGRWTRIGRALDTYRRAARGPLKSKYLCNIFAFLCLAPALRQYLLRLNAMVARSDRVWRTNGETIIGEPHYDARYFSCLCGARENIVTEAYDGHVWHELRVAPDRLVILPGSSAWRKWGIRPTLHRVLHTTQTSQPQAHANVTLLLGATASSVEAHSTLAFTSEGPAVRGKFAAM